MITVRVLTDICTLGDVDEELDVTDTPAIRSLIAAGHLAPVDEVPDDNDNDD